ncbi:MAG TPA: rhomboid family intramembrane serine protease [Anaerolineales bacterium]|nr:rhomboid family intramembrane serine protease [Anaerolineales bacterium]
MNNYPPASDPPQPAPAPQAVRVSLPQSAPYVTYSIIGITVFFYFLQRVSPLIWGYPTTFTNIDWLEFYGARINEAILAGELWRFLTPALLHGSFPHIAFNMYALLSFGTGLERHFGHGRFLLLYLVGAFTGNVVSFLFSSGYSVGASTAIFGLLGAEAVFLIQNRKVFAGRFRSAIGNIIFIAAINLFIIGSLPGIDNWGHIGGLLGGLVFTSFAGPLWEIEGIQSAYHLVDKRPARAVIIGAAIVVLIFGALAMWGMVRH